MEKFTKVVRIGRNNDLRANTYCKIDFDGKRLSITGVEGPSSSGNCLGSCGQIVAHLRSAAPGSFAFSPGWNDETLSKFVDVWDRWHLNDLRAGSPAQMEYLRANPVQFEYPKSRYDAASEALDAVGLNPEGGRYGSKWWHEDVPQDALTFLQSLPDTDMKPAWV